MFTGLIEARTRVTRNERRGTGLRLHLAAPVIELAGSFEVASGQSIAVSGACLTVVAQIDPRTGREVPFGTPGAELAFDLSAETLARTWFGDAAVGRVVNLERAMKLSDRLDGHLVSGHVDGSGRVVARQDSGDGGARFTFEVEPELERYLVDKGSVTLDGISLTVVAPREGRFDVAVIPLTLERTSLGTAAVGDRIHVEADLVGKWIERLMPTRSRS